MWLKDKPYLISISLLIVFNYMVGCAGQNFGRFNHVQESAGNVKSQHDRRETITWCTISKEEQQKCWNFAMANERDHINVRSERIKISCKQASNKEECMALLDQGEATITTLDVGAVFVGGRYHSLVPIAQQLYEGGFNYSYAVAVIKKGTLDDVQSLHHLRGRKACFAGVQTFAGWFLPINTLMKEGGMEIIDCNNHVKSATYYFGPSCAVNCLSDKYNPIGDNSDKLCQLCIGKIPGGRCTDDDPYAGYEGAFRCLLEAGEIAFLKHTTVKELISGGEFVGLTEDSFQLLCKDGTRRSLNEYFSCNWGKVPSDAIVTSSELSFENREKLQKFLQKFAERYPKLGNGTLLHQQNNQFGNAQPEYDQFGNRIQPEFDQYGNRIQTDQYGNRNRYKRQSFGNLGSQENRSRYGDNYGDSYRQDNYNQNYNPYNRDNQYNRDDNRDNQYNRDDNRDNLYNRDDNRDIQYNRDGNRDNQYNRDNNRDYQYNRDGNRDNQYNNQNDYGRESYSDPYRTTENYNRDSFARDPYLLNPEHYGINIDPYSTDIKPYNKPTDILVDDNDVDKNEHFNRTNGTLYEVFSLFDSIPLYGIHGNLLFQDSARGFVPVPETHQTYEAFLGPSYDVILGIRECPVASMTLCVTSDAEKNKCIKMRTALKAQLLKPEMNCYKGHSQKHCMQAIQARDADIAVLDASDVYTAGLNYGLVPFISEVYNLDDPEYYVVAVAKESDPSTELTYLKNKNTCHGGISTAAGWVYPLAFLISNGWIRPYGCNSIRAAAEYFSKSCVPGALSTEYNTGVPYDNMCDLCHGPSFRYCRRDASEDYYGHTGAFRCLVEGGGHVAFVKHTTVTENTGGKKREWWARDNLNDDYELLCPDGTRAEINEYHRCNLGKVKANAIVTRDNYGYNRTEIDAYINLFMYAQTFYGRKSTDEFSFSMFSSNPPYSDLIFQDATTQLKVIEPEHRNYYRYLGDDFMRARRIVDCYAGAATFSASIAILSVSALFSLFILRI